MKPAPRPLSFTDKEFGLVGGSPALDLINTTAWAADGMKNDRLATYGRLVEWATLAGVIDSSAAAAFVEVAGARVAESAEALETARSLRHLLRQLTLALLPVDERANEARDDLATSLASFNEVHAGAAGRLGVSVASSGAPHRFALTWPWERGRDHLEDLPLDAVLWPVVRDAARLFTSDEARYVRFCDGEGCGWAFVDRSRNRRRRWCEMETCGTRAKERRRGPRTR